MSVNTIHSTSIIDTGSEPITTAQAKLHASIDYTDYDSLIPIYISAARLAVEQATGLAIVEKTVKSQATIYKGYPLKVGYSPVITMNYVVGMGANSACQYNGDTGYVNNIGVSNEIISVEYDGMYEFEYSAGYETVPSDLKLAILQMFTFIFNNRGEYAEGKVDVSLEAQRIMGQNARFLV
jgi:hypothetical protein